MKYKLELIPMTSPESVGEIYKILRDNGYKNIRVHMKELKLVSYIETESEIDNSLIRLIKGLGLLWN